MCPEILLELTADSERFTRKLQTMSTSVWPCWTILLLFKVRVDPPNMI